MAESWHCGRGHTWGPAGGRGTLTVPGVCPVCGGAPDAAAPEPTLGVGEMTLADGSLPRPGDGAATQFLSAVPQGPAAADTTLALPAVPPDAAPPRTPVDDPDDATFVLPAVPAPPRGHPATEATALLHPDPGPYAQGPPAAPDVTLDEAAVLTGWPGPAATRQPPSPVTQAAGGESATAHGGLPHHTLLDVNLYQPSRAPDPTGRPAGSASGPATVAHAYPAARRAAALWPSVPGFEILGELGRGGMGVVYKARQAGLNRLVALKMILSAGRASADEQARFRAEAEAVARLDHPNVVRVYEVGEHNGLPFFSLEYVAGGTLSSRASGTPQPARRAAAVVRAVAEGVEAAHRRGILHRDLKPANVLMAPPADAAPDAGVPLDLCTPKVTDFGLAKKLEADSGQTRDGAILGTPSYMAPEQARGKVRTLGPPADVYSLGAILYDLLTGSPPFKGETAMETLQQVISREPLAPRKLQAKVPHDLSTICLKCLDKEPRKRYPTAAALAEDLRRYLDGEPIRARPTPWWERTLKWARRRPAAAALVVVSALAALAVCAGGYLYAGAEKARAETAEQGKRTEAGLREVAEGERDRADAARRRAEDNFLQACAAVDALLARIGTERLAYEPRLELLRRELLGEALAFYRRFLQERDDDATVRWQTARTHKNVADVHAMLGEPDKAEGHYRQAVNLLDRQRQEFPGERRYRLDLAASRFNLGRLLAEARKAAEAEREYAAARGLWAALRDETPGDPAVAQDLARSELNLGLVLRQRHRDAEAVSALTDALGVQRKLAEAPAASDAGRQARRELARVLNAVGGAHEDAGRSEEARAAYDEARGLLEQLIGGAKAVPELRQELAQTFTNLGRLRRDTDPAAAEQAYREAVRIDRMLAADFPATPAYRQDLAAALTNLGVLLQSSGRRPAAEEAFADALGLQKALAAAVAWVPDYGRDYAAGLNDRGIQLLTQQRLDEAEKAYGEGVGILRVLVAKHDGAAYRAELGRTLLNLAAARQAANKDAEAAALAREALQELEAAAASGDRPAYRLELARGRLTLGTLLQIAGRRALAGGDRSRASALLTESEKSYADGVEAANRLADESADEPDPRYQLASGRVTRASLRNALGRAADADADWEQGCGTFAKLADEYPAAAVYRADLARALGDWAAALAGRGKLAEAGERWERARGVQEALLTQFGAEPAYRIDLAVTLGNLGKVGLLTKLPDTAVEKLRRAVEVLRDFHGRGSDSQPYLRQRATSQADLARALADAGQSGASVTEGREAVRQLRKLAEQYPADLSLPPELSGAAFRLGGQLLDRNNPPEARNLFEESVRQIRTPAGAASWVKLPDALAALAEACLRQGDPAAAAQAADELARETGKAPDAPRRTADAAAFLSRCAGAASGKDATKSKEYGDRSLAALAKAVGQGFRDAERLKSPDFEAVRGRGDFQELLRKMGK